MNQVAPDSLGDMVLGYLAGLESGSLNLPNCHRSRTPAFKHGWLNGRDDRLGKPRERASVLLARARIIECNSDLGARA